MARWYLQANPIKASAQWRVRSVQAWVHDWPLEHRHPYRPATFCISTLIAAWVLRLICTEQDYEASLISTVASRTCSCTRPQGWLAEAAMSSRHTCPQPILARVKQSAGLEAPAVSPATKGQCSRTAPSVVQCPPGRAGWRSSPCTAPGRPSGCRPVQPGP